MFVAEIGDIGRFPGPAQLASWAGLAPKHRESDTTVHRGRITKQGSRQVRWAAVEAVQQVPAHPGQVVRELGRHRHRECDALDQLLTMIRAGQSRVLVLRGEAGIGKTTVGRHVHLHPLPAVDPACTCREVLAPSNALGRDVPR